MAESYDTDKRIQETDIILAALRSHLPDKDVTATKTLLEYGCGTGIIGLSLADRFAEVILVDSSANMIAEAQKKITGSASVNTRAFCADFAESTPEDMHADFVIVSLVLLHVADVPRLIESLHGLMNAGGHLIVVDFDKNEAVDSDKVHNGFDQDELATVMEEAGLSVTTSETFHYGEKMFMGKDASLFLLDAVKA